MKKILTCICLVQFIFGFSAPALAVETETRTFSIGVYDNYPKIYKDNQGVIKGFWADLLNNIALKENWKLEYIYDSWENNLKKLENGKIDIMVDVAISGERKNLYDFNNETALNSWGVLYTRKGVEISSFVDLEGKNIAVLKSGILYNDVGGLKNMLASFDIHPASIIDVKEYGDAFRLLENKTADVGVVNWFFGIANEKKYGVNRTNIIFQPSELRFAFPKNAPKNSYLIDIIDFDLRKLKDDPNSEYYKFIENNFGEFLPRVEKEIIPQWMWLLFIFIVFILSVIIIRLLIMKRYAQILKKEIEEKTRELTYKNAVLEGQYETSIDGILLVDADGKKIISSNKRFAEMWGIPAEMIKAKDDKKIIEFVQSQVANPETFTSKIEHLYGHKEERSFEEIELKDGKIFERYSSPVIDANKTQIGRIWSFRDITKRKA